MHKTLNGFNRYNRYNEHMDCIKGCLDCLGIKMSFPWLYGATGQAFIINMNASVNVDAAQEWDIDALFALGPNLGWRVERYYVGHEKALGLSAEAFLAEQHKAWDFVRAKIDQGFPCYGWELSPIPSYYGIYGYEVDDDALDEPGAYLYTGFYGEASCRWNALGTFDVKQVHVLSVQPCDPVPPEQAVKAALASVLERIEKPDGWTTRGAYTSGLPAYEVWAHALETGSAFRDGHSYLHQVWMECREMAVAFLQETLEHQLGVPVDLIDKAAAYYSNVYRHMKALYALFPDREQQDWVAQFSSLEGARLLREAAEAERQGVAVLREIMAALA